MKVLAGWVERAYEPDFSDPSSPLRISQPTVAGMLTAEMVRPMGYSNQIFGTGL